MQKIDISCKWYCQKGFDLIRFHRREVISENVCLKEWEKNMKRFAKLFFTIGMVAILTACGETQENTGVIVEGETVTQAGAAVT